MATIKVFRRGPDLHEFVTNIQRVVWATNPGFAEDDEHGISGVWAKETQHWCRFNGERRLLRKHKGEWVLTIYVGEVVNQQVLF